MSLENYLVKSSAFSEEIRWDFSEEEKQQLCSQLEDLGFENYQKYLRENLEDILRYISLAPSRRSAKKWKNRPDELLLRCAALQISDVTEQFRLQISDISEVVDRGSYREFHAIIAQALAPILLDQPVLDTPFYIFEERAHLYPDLDDEV